MADFFMQNPVFAAVILVALVLLVLAVVVVAIKRGYKKQLCRAVYQLVCLAEKNITGTKMGEIRKQQVVAWLHDLIPHILQVFITEESMSRLIDDAVQEMKRRLKEAAGDEITITTTPTTTETDKTAAPGGGGSEDA